MHPAVSASASVSFELLPRIAHKDVDALALFYDRWEAPVHAFVARLVPPEARERVVEAVFWAVWEHAADHARLSLPIDRWLHAHCIACCRSELATGRARPAPPRHRDPAVPAEWRSAGPFREAVPA